MTHEEHAAVFRKTGSMHAPRSLDPKTPAIFSPALSIYSKVLVFITALLILAGGLVTSTGSGLSVPDWPLSYGKWMPPMVGGIRYEHSHRMIASLVGLMTLVLTFWVLGVEKRKWVRYLTIGAFFAVVVQGILGGLTVKYLLPPPISIFHACLAQTFFSLVTAISFFLSREWISPHFYSEDLSRLKRILLTLAGFVYLQLILGATVRHTGWMGALIPHIIVAFLVLFHAILVLVRAFNAHSDEVRIKGPALFIGFLALIQMSLGMGAFIYRIILPPSSVPTAGEVLFRTAHQTTGALVLAFSVFFILRVFRMGKKECAVSR